MGKLQFCGEEWQLTNKKGGQSRCTDRWTDRIGVVKPKGYDRREHHRIAMSSGGRFGIFCEGRSEVFTKRREILTVEVLRPINTAHKRDISQKKITSNRDYKNYIATYIETESNVICIGRAMKEENIKKKYPLAKSVYWETKSGNFSKVVKL